MERGEVSGLEGWICTGMVAQPDLQVEIISGFWGGKDSSGAEGLQEGRERESSHLSSRSVAAETGTLMMK